MLEISQFQTPVLDGRMFNGHIGHFEGDHRVPQHRLAHRVPHRQRQRDRLLRQGDGEAGRTGCAGRSALPRPTEGVQPHVDQHRRWLHPRRSGAAFQRAERCRAAGDLQQRPDQAVGDRRCRRECPHPYLGGPGRV